MKNRKKRKKNRYKTETRNGREKSRMKEWNKNNNNNRRRLMKAVDKRGSKGDKKKDVCKTETNESMKMLSMNE